MAESTLKIKVHTSDSASADAFVPYEINGYRIEKPLTANDSGFSKWGFCEKFGKPFFLKEFLSPKYPKEDAPITPQQRAARIQECSDWFQSKQEIYRRIMKSATGNLVVPSDFFRFKNQFYLVTERVAPGAVSFSDLHLQSPVQQHLVLSVLAHSFAALERNGVVHADVKPNNLILKETVDGFFTVKLIDFDASFLEEKQPEPEDLMGDAAYYSPEAILRMMEEDVPVTTKSDLFALGILFHQILSGELPGLPEDSEASSIGEAVLNEEPIQISQAIPEKYRDLIRQLLLPDPASRPSAKQLFEELRKLHPDGKTWEGSCQIFPEPELSASQSKESETSAGSNRWSRCTDLD